MTLPQSVLFSQHVGFSIKNNRNMVFPLFGSFLLLFLLSGVSFSAQTNDVQTIYVDQNSQAEVSTGSKEAPFRSISEAQNFVRKMKSRESVQVVIGKGTYYLKEPLTFKNADSGTESNPIIYRAEKTGDTILSGGLPVAADLFQPVSNRKDLARLDTGAKDRILCVDLNPLGIPQMKETGLKRQMPLGIPELFVDGKRMTIARWPNDGWAFVKKIIDGGSPANSGNAADASKMSKVSPSHMRGGIFTYDGDRPNRWNTEKGVWLHGYWCFDWSSEVLKVAKIDLEKKEIELAGQHTYGLRHGNPSPRRWMAVNILEELDAPGEYYIDRETNRLFLYPEKNLKNSEIVLAYQYQPIVRFQSAQGIVLKGFQIVHSYSNGVLATNSTGIRIEECRICNTREFGLFMIDVTNSTIRSCLIEQTGIGGIFISGGDRVKLVSSNNLVTNNIIRSFSQHRLCYADGLALRGVGITASHNELYDAPHQAISLSANNCVFEYNIVHDVCLGGDDCGALYKGRNPSMTGNVIRYNYWYNIGSPRGQGNAAIYFDDGDGGEKVFGNIFYRSGDPGRGNFGTIFSHGGHDNLVENNIFIDCKRPIGSSPWNDKSWKNYIDSPLWLNRLLKEVNITDPIYTSRYPHLIDFMKGAPAEKRRNFAKKNLFINPTKKITGNWTLDDSNWTTDRDPGFVDLKNKDFRLKPDADVYKKIPGFQPIPFEKIGVLYPPPF